MHTDRQTNRSKDELQRAFAFLSMFQFLPPSLPPSLFLSPPLSSNNLFARSIKGGREGGKEEKQKARPTVLYFCFIFFSSPPPLSLSCRPFLHQRGGGGVEGRKGGRGEGGEGGEAGNTKPT
jgi:hypothetical protein